MMPQHCSTGAMGCGIPTCIGHWSRAAMDKVNPQDSSSPVCKCVGKPVSGAVSLMSIRSKGILKGSGLQQ